MNSSYEKDYKNLNHFSFGKNWQNFLSSLTEQRIKVAKKSLQDWLGNNLKNKTFVDVGCGSGLFSLAAYKLGAKQIVSIDVDEFSLRCAKELHKREGSPTNWTIHAGSALDEKFMKSLGSYDIVYSWGVLHHTGDMYAALKNTSSLVAPKGRLFIALYNNNQKIMEGTSPFWLKIKSFYNSCGALHKKTLEIIYIVYYIVGLTLNGVNPITYITRYDSLRGMSFWIDIKDWLGGLPYEYASIETIVKFFNRAGFKADRTRAARSIGCNEFLFCAKD